MWEEKLLPLRQERVALRVQRRGCGRLELSSGNQTIPSGQRSHSQAKAGCPHSGCVVDSRIGPMYQAFRKGESKQISTC